ncbi:MAG: hypothetical protein R3B09_01685 [Nannocystaceae bacterium]
MADLVDAMMGVLGIVERVTQLREEQQARAALEEWVIECDEEIDGLAEIDRIRAEAGLAPDRRWPSTRRPTRGRWAPTSDVYDAPSPGPSARTPPPEPPRSEPPPPEPPLDLGPREHVECAEEILNDTEVAPPTVVEAEVHDADVGDANCADADAEVVDAEIVAEFLYTDVAEVLDAEVAEVVDAELGAPPSPQPPATLTSTEPLGVEQLDLFADRPATLASEEPLNTKPLQLDLFADFIAGAEVGAAEADKPSTVSALPVEITPPTLSPTDEPANVETTAAPEPIEVHALAVATPSEPPAEERALRDALMTAEAARARPAEARRLYEEVLIVAARPNAPYPQALYAALALLGTSECDLELGDLDAAMANSGDAWSWARRAHRQHPSDETLQVLSLAAQNHAQAAEHSGDRQQLTEVLGECLSVIEPELARSDLPAAREVRFGLRSRLMKLAQPTTSLVRKGAFTPSLTLTTMQGVRP